jgi:hypothetical protein
LILKYCRDYRYSSSVEHVLIICRPLGLIPSTKNTRGRREGEEEGRKRGRKEEGNKML